jgi:hypothetical protein
MAANLWDKKIKDKIRRKFKKKKLMIAVDLPLL